MNNKDNGKLRIANPLSQWQAAFVIIVLLWAGMILGISFLEAWAKFQTPMLTLQAGLDIGRHVYGVFRIVEVILALLGLISLYNSNSTSKWKLLYFTVLISVAIQNLYLMPAMNHQILRIFSGQIPAYPQFHTFYIVLETYKVSCLLFLALWTMTSYG